MSARSVDTAAAFCFFGQNGSAILRFGISLMVSKGRQKAGFFKSECFRRRSGKEGNMEEFLKAGVISSTHGVRGEVKVFPTTGEPERFRSLKKVYLDTGKEKIRLEIAGVKFFKQFAILKFRGIDNINDIEKYRGCSLWVEREDAVPLEEDEYYIGDLIGMDVFTEDETLFGVLKDVMETGANDVYIIDTEEHGEVLVPAIHDCILDVDIEERRMKIRLLPGLI